MASSESFTLVDRSVPAPHLRDEAGSRHQHQGRISEQSALWGTDLGQKPPSLPTHTEWQQTLQHDSSLAVELPVSTGTEPSEWQISPRTSPVLVDANHSTNALCDVECGPTPSSTFTPTPTCSAQDIFQSLPIEVLCLIATWLWIMPDPRFCAWMMITFDEPVPEEDSDGEWYPDEEPPVCRLGFNTAPQGLWPEGKPIGKDIKAHCLDLTDEIGAYRRTALAWSPLLGNQSWSLTMRLNHTFNILQRRMVEVGYPEAYRDEMWLREDGPKFEMTCSATPWNSDLKPCNWTPNERRFVFDNAMTILARYMRIGKATHDWFIRPRSNAHGMVLVDCGDVESNPGPPKKAWKAKDLLACGDVEANPGPSGMATRRWKVKLPAATNQSPAQDPPCSRKPGKTNGRWKVKQSYLNAVRLSAPAKCKQEVVAKESTAQPSSHAKSTKVTRSSTSTQYPVATFLHVSARPNVDHAEEAIFLAIVVEPDVVLLLTYVEDYYSVMPNNVRRYLQGSSVKWAAKVLEVSGLPANGRGVVDHILTVGARHAYNYPPNTLRAINSAIHDHQIDEPIARSAIEEHQARHWALLEARVSLRIANIQAEALKDSKKIVKLVNEEHTRRSALQDDCLSQLRRLAARYSNVSEPTSVARAPSPPVLERACRWAVAQHTVFQLEIATPPDCVDASHILGATRPLSHGVMQYTNLKLGDFESFMASVAHLAPSDIEGHCEALLLQGVPVPLDCGLTIQFYLSKLFGIPVDTLSGPVSLRQMCQFAAPLHIPVVHFRIQTALDRARKNEYVIFLNDAHWTLLYNPNVAPLFNWVSPVAPTCAVKCSHCAELRVPRCPHMLHVRQLVGIPTRTRFSEGCSCPAPLGCMVYPCPHEEAARLNHQPHRRIDRYLALMFDEPDHDDAAVTRVRRLLAPAFRQPDAALYRKMYLTTMSTSRFRGMHWEWAPGPDVCVETAVTSLRRVHTHQGVLTGSHEAPSPARIYHFVEEGAVPTSYVENFRFNEDDFGPIYENANLLAKVFDWFRALITGAGFAGRRGGMAGITEDYRSLWTGTRAGRWNKTYAGSGWGWEFSPVPVSMRSLSFRIPKHVYTWHQMSWPFVELANLRDPECYTMRNIPPCTLDYLSYGVSLAAPEMAEHVVMRSLNALSNPTTELQVKCVAELANTFPVLGPLEKQAIAASVVKYLNQQRAVAPTVVRTFRFRPAIPQHVNDPPSPSADTAVQTEAFTPNHDAAIAATELTRCSKQLTVVHRVVDFHNPPDPCLQEVCIIPERSPTDLALPLLFEEALPGPSEGSAREEGGPAPSSSPCSRKGKERVNILSEKDDLHYQPGQAVNYVELMGGWPAAADAFGFGGHSKGLPIENPELVKAERACVICNGIPNGQHTWVRGTCEACYSRLKQQGNLLKKAATPYAFERGLKRFRDGWIALPGFPLIPPVGPWGDLSDQHSNMVSPPIREAFPKLKELSGNLQYDTSHRRVGKREQMYDEYQRHLFMSTLVGIGCTKPPTTFAPTQKNYDIAATLRMGAKVLKDEPSKLERMIEFYAFLRKFVVKFARVIFAGSFRGVLRQVDIEGHEHFEKWVSRFPGPVQTRLRDARKRVSETGVTKRDGKFTLLLKQEFADAGAPTYNSPELNTYWGQPDRNTPRIIQAPEAEAHAVMGPWCWATTLLLKKLLPAWHFIHYAGCDKPEELDAWADTTEAAFPPGNFFLEADISQMDASYSKPLLQFIWWFYSLLGWPSSGNVPKIFWWWAKPRGRSRDGVRYSADYMNASGRDDTAVMNGLMNSLIMIVSAARMKPDGTNRSLQDVLTMKPTLLRDHLWQMRGIVQGDDSLAAFPSSFGRALHSGCVDDTYARAGFKTTSTVKRNFLLSIFLGSRPWPCLVAEGMSKVRHIRWGPTLGRRLIKFGWQRTRDSQPNVRMYQVADAVARAYPHVPLLSEVAQRTALILQNHAKVAARRPAPIDLSNWDKLRVKRSPAETHPDALWMLAEIYGVGHASYEEFRTKLGCLRSLPQFLDCDALRRVVTIDDC